MDITVIAIVYMPLFFAGLLLFLGMFSHVNFKYASLKSVRIIMAIIGGLFGFMYFSTMYRGLLSYGMVVSNMHYFLLISFVACTIVTGIISRRITPTLMQFIGLCVVATSGFFLLAS